ncbi:MAG TPA: hypothetical protein VHE32_03160 [Rhodanobacteraceae bacterium]|nr:hypothetical protein [Rhodanobacteraceae bacterium]
MMHHAIPKFPKRLLLLALIATPCAFAGPVRGPASGGPAFSSFKPSAPAVGTAICTSNAPGSVCIPIALPVISNYDDLVEGTLGTSTVYNGVSYHDVNGIGGVFPDGSTFTADDVGDELIIEDSTDLFVDFPDFGSSPNTLTFGSVWIPGPNLSIGPLVRVTMDLDVPARAASVDLAYYENGPWGRIEFHLDALDAGKVVASDVLTIADGGGRDNPTTTTLSVSAGSFDSLKLYATYDGQPSAPRGLIDNLALTPAQ